MGQLALSYRPVQCIQEHISIPMVPSGAGRSLAGCPGKRLILVKGTLVALTSRANGKGKQDEFIRWINGA